MWNAAQCLVNIVYISLCVSRRRSWQTASHCCIVSIHKTRPTGLLACSMLGRKLLNSLTWWAPQLCISNVPSINHFSTNSISYWCLTLTQSPCANAMPLLLRIINEKCPQLTWRHWQSAEAGSRRQGGKRGRFIGGSKAIGLKLGVGFCGGNC